MQGTAAGTISGTGTIQTDNMAKKTKKKTKRAKAKPIDYSKPLARDKYESFCQEYIRDNNKTQAAIRAGYSKNRADSRGSHLWGISSIRKRVRYLQSKKAEAISCDNQELLKEFKEIGFGKVSKTLSNKHKISALENIGKHIGFYERHNKQIQDNVTFILQEIGASGAGLPIKNTQAVPE
jgi:phage terminase small subunit